MQCLSECRLEQSRADLDIATSFAIDLRRLCPLAAGPQNTLVSWTQRACMYTYITGGLSVRGASDFPGVVCRSLWPL